MLSQVTSTHLQTLLPPAFRTSRLSSRTVGKHCLSHTYFTDQPVKNHYVLLSMWVSNHQFPKQFYLLPSPHVAPYLSTRISQVSAHLLRYLYSVDYIFQKQDGECKVFTRHQSILSPFHTLSTVFGNKARRRDDVFKSMSALSNAVSCFPLTYLLTPWSRVLPEKLKRPELLKKFPAFMEPEGS
jgi:hypothetical protein